MWVAAYHGLEGKRLRKCSPVTQAPEGLLLVYTRVPLLPFRMYLASEAWDTRRVRRRYRYVV